MNDEKKRLASVIIVSYNEAQYIHQAIESCLSMKGEGIEIIIGDDGSNDGSIGIIQEYVQKYPEKIRYFVQDRSDIVDIIPSIRVSNSIKRALGMARGEYVVCLSGDDFFVDDQVIVEAADFLNSHPRHSAYVSDFKYLWPDNSEQAVHSAYPALLSWGGTYIHLSSFVFRKSVYDRGLLLQRFCDDTGLIYSLACAGKWAYTGKVSFAYRQREKSIMHEADDVELKIAELMLMQDILCKRKINENPVKNFWLRTILFFSSMSRFGTPIAVLLRSRKIIGNYGKYLRSCSKYEHDYLGMLARFDTLGMMAKCKIYGLYLISKVEYVYRVLRKCYDLLHPYTKP